MTEIAFNDRSSTMALLLSRRSGKARNLVAPGPDEAELSVILAAAARVPDHGKLHPWRFVVIRDRAAFAALIQQCYAAANGPPGKVEARALDEFARQAPVLVAVISLAAPEMRIPEWEQILTAGAACQNLLLAAHAQGFAGNWLTGPAAYLPGMAEGLGVPGGRIAGYFFIGTPEKPLEERPRPEPELVIRHWPG